ncbi:uncharacterized protein LOC131805936 [Musca domestica]|uniref:Uncharacterized protein LOC131805936 n=1 Tax=Musca domestica TaxID=7370 RepID=A0ABM3VIT3_MUSDO|nr:uncharacterized protein LOC131805936 [Musca domestica]
MEMEYEVPQKKSRGKPKVAKEWAEEDIFKLIALVEEQSCLWNAGCDGYHNKILRDNAWRHISEQFDDKYTPADLTAKWTNLRIQYRGYAARSKTKSGQGAIEPPKWRFFNVMKFVGRNEEAQTQDTISNILIEIDSESNSFDVCASPSLPTPPPTSTPRRLQAPTVQSATTQIAETMREAVAAMKERNQNSLDPNTSFANYLLSELKTLSDSGSASVRNKVTLFFLQCLEEERSNHLFEC